jgi:hypothetical protein
MVMDKLPHNPAARHHAWSDDPARDRAVRLAEDGVERRATLEEAIACAFGYDEASARRACDEVKSWPEDVQKDCRFVLGDLLEQGVPRLQALVEAWRSGKGLVAARYPSIIPKSASASSAAEHENKGESMTAEKFVEATKNIRGTDMAGQPYVTTPNPFKGDGMRTERVVVEIEHSGSEPINLDDLALHLRTRLGQFVGLRLTPESAHASAPAAEPVAWLTDHENKGESMSGMRTERVTLEIVHDENDSAAEWPWDVIISGEDRWGFFPDKGESVRVVPESEGVSWKQVYDEGKRISREEGYKILTAEIGALHAERDALAARVAELKNENGHLGMAAEINFEACHKAKARVAALESQLESVACRAATAENRVAELEGTVKESLTVAAPAAEPVANNSANPNGSAEPVASTRQHEASEGILALEHMLYVFRDDERPTVLHRMEKLRRLVEVYRDHIVPLFFAPPQQRGWLTEEERNELVTLAACQERDSEYFERCREPDHASAARERAAVVRALLARNSPPVVVLPPSVHTDILAALAAAGVKIKEVGR